MTTAVTIVSESGIDPEKIKELLEKDPRLGSANTRRGYTHDLAHWLAWSAGRPFTKLLVEQYAALLQCEGMDRRSINRALSAIRWLARKMADIAYETTPPSEEREQFIGHALRVATVKNLKAPEKTPAEVGRHIPPGEIDAFMRTLGNDHSATGVRDTAILAVAVNSGPRVQELAHVKLSDYDPETGVLVFRKSKGNKTRNTYLYNGSGKAMAAWLAIRGDDPGPLFYAIRRGGHIQVGKGMSTEALRQMLQKRCEQAGISQTTGFHDFRRTFAGDLLDAGEDISTIQKLMGHASPVTTAGYDRRPEERRQKALAKRHVPYYGRQLV